MGKECQCKLNIGKIDALNSGNYRVKKALLSDNDVYGGSTVRYDMERVNTDEHFGHRGTTDDVFVV